ncbi:HD domain-containing protein [Peloplasma aerotolerans]|uniref:HD domain-containing protein n=1 Tax=Peloplasma aerotolerans TaxID=3044389 RepID=A0AAW6UD14_9MOLU|nr:HD domain-containing protein [Mariniplasma sp. M4Ah]MDI6453534.1 HD domain-containing protein [Mariniplasma sp. M4Ah]MDR4968583.1 HD domain-containing protein [Acholeplasmataceae bacterium]
MEKELLTYLYNKIIPLYRHFDDAHQMDHVEKVIENSIEIAKPYEVNHDMVYVIACYHDIGMQFGRNDHHITGGLFLYNDQELSKYFTKEQRRIMKEAVEDHRASNDEPPRSIYGKIIAEADRDIDIDIVVTRTIQYGFKHYPDSNEEEHIKRAYQHIEEKYGPNGYLKLWLETKKNRDGLNKIHHLLSDSKTLRTLIFEHYKKIKNK